MSIIFRTFVQMLLSVPCTSLHYCYFGELVNIRQFYLCFACITGLKLILCSKFLNQFSGGMLMRKKVSVVLALAMIVSGPAAAQFTVSAAEDVLLEDSYVLSDEDENVLSNEDDFILSDEDDSILSIEDEPSLSDEEISLTYGEDNSLDLEEDSLSLDEEEITWDLEEEKEEVTAVKMIIEDGMAQPMVKYSEIADGYTNKNSDILRFAVYVETDYDTDEDGKKDLVQAVVQVPRAAAEQKYDAPTIFEASPYFAGTSSDLGLADEDPTIPQGASADEVGNWNESSLYDTSAGARRTYNASDIISSSALAGRDDEAAFSSHNWFYNYPDAPKNSGYFYNSLTGHDYFLIRGFAVVESAGLGTKGSEGLETCGSIAEVSAFKNVVEWINHKEGRHAFADKAGTIPIEADWSNGRVAMRGCSYNGTMAYEVAATGVEGLETIVPEAGIASWYEYSNTQGVSHYADNRYTSFLAAGCASRFFTPAPSEAEASAAWATLRSLCSKLFGFFNIAQEKLAGHYGPYWESREYSYSDKIHIPALIVTGLNDYNVNAKQADLMRQAFERNSQDVRMILHQGAHETLETIMIDGMFYEEILNKWYCHYLLDVDNGMPNDLPPVYVQSNVNGDFLRYDKWYGDEALRYDFANSEELTLLHPDAADPAQPEENTEEPNPEYHDGYSDIMMSGDDPYFTMEDYISALGIEADAPKANEENGLYWESLVKRVPEEITLQGKATVTVKAKVPTLPEEGKRMVLGAFLYDISDTSFPAYNLESANISRSLYLYEGIYRGDGIPNYNIETFKQTPVKKKLITKGMIDLGSPNAGYYPRTATQGSISADTYYDYTIHMIPTVYTIQPGHYLWLYLIPGMDGIDSDVDIMLSSNAGSVSIPVKDIPEDFTSNDDFTEECTEDPSGKRIVEKVNGQEVAVKIVDVNNNITTVSSKLWIKNLFPEYTYLGVPVTPQIDVYDGTQLLNPEKDYKITYSNNTKPTEISGKDSKLTITFKGDYSKTQPVVQTYRIAKASLSDTAEESDVFALDATTAYTGKSIKPVPILKYNCDDGKEISASTFKLSYLKEGASEAVTAIAEAGEYTIIIEPKDAKSYFTGKMTAHLSVINDKNKLLQNAKVTFTPNTYAYTGKAIIPEAGTYTLQLKLDGKTPTTLTERSDYTVSSVRNNTEPGKAEVVFNAVEGNDKGLTGSVTATFTIKKGKDLSSLADNEIYYENYVRYSKGGATPSWVILYDNGVLLEKGRDYTISYKNNKSLTPSDGSKNAKLIIKGKGKYKGTITRDFTVVRCPIDDMTVRVKDKVIPTKLPTKGKGYENPQITITDPQGKKLKAGTEYKIEAYLTDNESNSYSPMTEDGKTCLIMVTISGLGNYCGDNFGYYMYYDKKNDLSKTTVWKSISPKTFDGNPTELTYSDLHEMFATGTKKNPGTYLEPDTDFVVEEYRNNTKPGTASVVLRGRGIYGGTKTLKFTIKPKEPKTFLGILNKQ